MVWALGERGRKKIESYLALGLNELVDRPFSERNSAEVQVLEEKARSLLGPCAF